MGSTAYPDILDLSLVGLGLQLYPHNPSSPRQLRLRIDSDPSYGYKRLRLTGEELAKPPSSIWKLKELEYLDMSPGERCDTCNHHQLSRLPSDVVKLVNLRILCLDTNQLNEIPLEIGLLHNLERLILSNNLLTDLPVSLGGLAKLCSLHLANNYLTEIPKPVFLLKELQFLDACDNNIAHLSPDIGSLSKLESLLLMCNLLKAIPDTIGNCVLLKTLWLGMNRIEELPRSMGKLCELDWGKSSSSSNIEGNPLEKPPLEICKQGPLAIEEYYRNKEVLEKILVRNESPKNTPEPTLKTTNRIASETAKNTPEPNLKSSNKTRSERGNNDSKLPSAHNKSRSPSSTSCKNEKQGTTSPLAPTITNNNWMVTPVNDPQQQTNDRINSRCTSQAYSSITATQKNASRVSSGFPYLAISSSSTPALSSASRRGTGEGRRSMMSREYNPPPRSSKSTPAMRMTEEPALSRTSYRSDSAVDNDTRDILKRRPSTYVDYVRAKAWEHVSVSIPSPGGGKRVELSPVSMSTSSALIGKAMKQPATPRSPLYYYSFNKTKDIQILKVAGDAKSPNGRNDNPDQKSDPQSSQRAKPSSRANASRGSVELSYFASFSPPLPHINPISARREIKSDQHGRHELERAATNVSQNDNMNEKPVSRSSHKANGEDEKESEENEQMNKSNKTPVLPVLIVNSGANSPMPPSKQMSVDGEVTKTSPAPSARTRRRGYVVEKRLMGNKKSNRRWQSGKKTQTLAPAVEERPDTELTFVQQQQDVSDEEEDKEVSEQQAYDNVKSGTPGSRMNESDKGPPAQQMKPDDNEQQKATLEDNDGVKTEPLMSNNIDQEERLTGKDSLRASRAGRVIHRNSSNKKSAKKRASVKELASGTERLSTKDRASVKEGASDKKLASGTEKAPEEKERAPVKDRAPAKEKASAKPTAWTKEKASARKRASTNERASAKNRASAKERASAGKRASTNERTSAKNRASAKEQASTNVADPFHEKENIENTSKHGHDNITGVPKENERIISTKKSQSANLANSLRNISKNINHDELSPSKKNARNNKRRVKSSRKWKPIGSRAPLSHTEEFAMARELLGPVLCRDCELKHLIQSYSDSIKSE